MSMLDNVESTFMHAGAVKTNKKPEFSNSLIDLVRNSAKKSNISLHRTWRWMLCFDDAVSYSKIGELQKIK